MTMLLVLASLSEGLTGLILLVDPALVIRLLFASDIAGAGDSMSRLAGLSLIALGVACWPDRNTPRAFLGMLTFGLLAALFLSYVGVNGKVGLLLWPAVGVHTGLSILLVRAWWKIQTRSHPRRP